MIALFWRAIKGRSLRDGAFFTSGPESKNRFNRRLLFLQLEGWSADRAESGDATSRACCQPLQHTDWIEAPDSGCAYGDGESCSRRPRAPRYSWRHCNCRNPADPVSGFKRAVKAVRSSACGAELLRDRIIVCESDYLGNVKLEAVSQLPYELLGGQRDKHYSRRQ